MPKPSTVRLLAWLSCAILTCTAFVIPVAGQSPVWVLTVPANPDHLTIVQTVPVVDHYELVLTRQGGTVLPAHNLGKPALVPSCTLSGSTSIVTNCIQVSVDAYLMSLPPGTYSGILWVVGPGGQAVSPASGLFSLGGTCTGPAGTAADFTVSHRVTSVTATAVTVEVTVTDCVGVVRTALVPPFPPR